MYSSMFLSSNVWKCLDEVLLKSSEKIAILVSRITRGLAVVRLAKMRDRLTSITLSISSDPSANIESVSLTENDLVSPSMIMLNSRCSNFLLRGDLLYVDVVMVSVSPLAKAAAVSRWAVPV